MSMMQQIDLDCFYRFNTATLTVSIRGTQGTQYVVPACGIFVCTDCSGKHMACGQRVKSISMGKFTAEEIKMLEDGGNEAAARAYLATYKGEGDAGRPVDKNPRKTEAWIRSVLVDKRYWVSPPDTPTGTQDANKIPIKPLSEILGASSSSLKLTTGGRISDAGGAATEAKKQNGMPPAQPPAQPAPAVFDPFGCDSVPTAPAAAPGPQAAITSKPAATATYDFFEDAAFTQPVPAAVNPTPAAVAATVKDEPFDPFGEAAFPAAPAAQPVSVPAVANVPSSIPAAHAPPPPAAAFHMPPPPPPPSTAYVHPTQYSQLPPPAPTLHAPPPPMPPVSTSQAPPAPPIPTATPVTNVSETHSAPAPAQPVEGFGADEAADWGAFEAAGSSVTSVSAPAIAPAAASASVSAASAAFDPFGEEAAFPAVPVAQPTVPSASATQPQPSATPATQPLPAAPTSRDTLGVPAGAGSAPAPLSTTASISSNPAAAGATGGSSRNVREELPSDWFSEAPAPAPAPAGVPGAYVGLPAAMAGLNVAAGPAPAAYGQMQAGARYVPQPPPHGGQPGQQIVPSGAGMPQNFAPGYGPPAQPFPAGQHQQHQQYQQFAHNQQQQPQGQQFSAGLHGPAGVPPAGQPQYAQQASYGAAAGQPPFPQQAPYGAPTGQPPFEQQALYGAPTGHPPYSQQPSYGAPTGHPQFAQQASYGAPPGQPQFGQQATYAPPMQAQLMSGAAALPPSQGPYSMHSGSSAASAHPHGHFMPSGVPPGPGMPGAVSAGGPTMQGNGASLQNAGGFGQFVGSSGSPSASAQPAPSAADMAFSNLVPDFKKMQPAPQMASAGNPFA